MSRLLDSVRERWADHAKDRAEHRIWSRADSVEALGEATADWLEGRLSYQPGGYDEPDPETVELIPALAALNRSGLVTIGSQPGLGPIRGYDGHWWWQRAAVDGFASRETAERLREDANSKGLIVVQHDQAKLFCSYRDAVDCTRGSPYCWPEPIEGRSWVHTVFGTRLSYRDIETYFAGYTRAQMVLYRTPQLAIVDPVWGRNTMWEALTGVPVLERVAAQYRESQPWLEDEEATSRERIEIDHRDREHPDRSLEDERDDNAYEAALTSEIDPLTRESRDAIRGELDRERDGGPADALDVSGRYDEIADCPNDFHDEATDERGRELIPDPAEVDNSERERIHKEDRIDTAAVRYRAHVERADSTDLVKEVEREQ